MRIRILGALLILAIGAASWTAIKRHRQSKWLVDYREAADSYERLHYADAEVQLRAILPSAEKWWPNGRQLADTLNLLALVYSSEGRGREAEPLYDRAIAILERQPGDSSLDLAKAYANEGNIFLKEGKTEAAQHRLNEALLVYQQNPEAAGVELGSVLHSLGVVQAMQGRFSEAQPLMQQGLKIYEQYLPPAHPDLAQAYLDLAGLLRMQKEITEANDYDRKALAIQEKLFGNDSPVVRETELRIGSAPGKSSAAKSTSPDKSLARAASAK